MKRSFTLFFIIAALAAALLAVPAGAAEITASGNCGENLTWTLDSNGLLTISGTGDMQDCSGGNAPWESDRDQISRVSIGSGVTGIGASAFYSCKNLTAVNAWQVRTIGPSAFAYCTELTSVRLPNAVTIGSSAFRECSNLNTVSLVRAVSIGSYAFFNCEKLTDMELPLTLTSIGDHAFMYCKSLPAITIPTLVTYIGTDAFYGCTGMDAVTFRGNVPGFGQQVFECVTANAYYPPWDSTWTQSARVSYGGQLDWAPIPELYGLPSNDGLMRTVYTSGDLVISGSGPMTTPCEYRDIDVLTIQSGVTGIGRGTTGFSNLEVLIIPDTVTEIYEFCFLSFFHLHTVTVDSGNKNFFTTDGVLFQKEPSVLVCYPAQRAATDYTVPQGVTRIGSAAFSNTRLENLTIQTGVTTVGSEAFQGSALRSITFADTVTEIGECSFRDASYLSSIALPGGLTAISTHLFDYCEALEEIVIPASVKAIGDGAFTCCEALKKVVFLGDAPTFGNYVFNLVNADAYYPAQNDTWTEDRMKLNYGTLRWIPWHSCEDFGEEHRSVRDEAQPSTCTQPGLGEGSHCSRCNTVLAEQQVLPVAPHTFVSPSFTWANNLTAATVSAVCSACGHNEEQGCTLRWDSSRQGRLTATVEAEMGAAMFRDTREISAGLENGIITITLPAETSGWRIFVAAYDDGMMTHCVEAKIQTDAARVSATGENTHIFFLSSDLYPVSPALHI